MNKTLRQQIKDILKTSETITTEDGYIMEIVRVGGLRKALKESEHEELKRISESGLFYLPSLEKIEELKEAIEKEVSRNAVKNNVPEYFITGLPMRISALRIMSGRFDGILFECGLERIRMEWVEGPKWSLPYCRKVIEAIF